MQELPRENPWHLRIPITEHHQWFRNLVDLHRLTEAWRQATLPKQETQLKKEVHAKNATHPKNATENLTAGISAQLGRKVKESLWMLDHLLDRNIEQFMDDTLPEDMLGRLDHAVWAVQAGTLTAISAAIESPEIMESPPSPTVVVQALEQTSWNLGRACAEERWRPLLRRGDQDLRGVVLALQDTPFSGYPRGDGFLVKRAIRTEIEIELHSCPHHSPYAEVNSVADHLCHFHAHWMRGFASSLNRKIEVELYPRPRLGQHRCLQRWYLIKDTPEGGESNDSANSPGP